MRQHALMHEESEAASRLAGFGLSVGMFERVLLGAEAEARTYTLLDPPNLQGMARYSRTVRLLREELLPLGWTFDNPRNLARTVSLDGQVAIIATLGDAATGVPGLVPSTRYEKGVATIEAVNRNFLQLTLPIDLGDDGPIDETPIDDGLHGTATWILLYNVTESEIRAELSLPDSMVDGFVDTWLERIILPPVSLQPAVPAVPVMPAGQRAAPADQRPEPVAGFAAIPGQTRAPDPDVAVSRRSA